MAIPHSAIVILLCVEKTSVCLAKSNCFVAFPTKKTSLSVSPRIPAYIPTTKSGRLQPHDSCNHQFLCKGTKSLHCNVVNNIHTISVCKLSYTGITLKTVESCTNAHKFYSEVTVTMITVKYFWPQNSVVKELWFCCN